MEKKRLDVLLVERGLARSREEAKRMIHIGGVYTGGKQLTKPGENLLCDAPLDVRAGRIPFVSRGGLKLEKALHCFPVILTGCTALDIGASTGGFTDCMLQAGAARVYAVDVGTAQLAPALCADPRVVNLEQTNIRSLTAEQIPQPVDFFCTDVSFISLTLVLPVAARFLRDGGEGICLIKPQFEVGKGGVGKNGVVRDMRLHTRVLQAIPACAVQNGLSVRGLDFSPIQGPEGNIEYLMFVRKESPPGLHIPFHAEELVRRAHRSFEHRAGTADT